MRPLPRHHPQRHVTVIIAGQALAVTEEEEEEEGVTDYSYNVLCIKREVIITSNITLTLHPSWCTEG